MDNKKIETYQKYLFLILSFLFIFAGVFIRTKIWLHSGGFWSDEGCVLYNIINRDFIYLFMPLSYIQCTPPMFLVLAKILYGVFGLNSTVLRFVPYSVSIAALIVFSFFSYKTTKGKLSALLAIILFSLHNELFFFTQAFKQYSSDVLFAILISYSFLVLKGKNLSDKSKFVLGIAAVISFLCSYTAVFVTGIFSIAYIVSCILKKNYSKIKSFMFFLLPVLTGFMIYFFSNCLPAIKNEMLQNYWHFQEPFFPSNIEQVKELIRFLTGYYDINIFAISILFTVGAFNFYKQNKFLFFSCLLLFINAVLMAVTNIYPFNASRISVYLVPFFLVFAANAVNLTKNTFVKLLIFFTALYFACPIQKIYDIRDILSQKTVYKLSNAEYFVKELYNSDIKSDDYVYVDLPSQVIFEVYDTEKRISPEQIFYEIQFGSIEKTLNMFPTGKNIFFYISNDYIFNNNYEIFNNYIKENCNIIYKKDSENGSFIKCRKIPKKAK